MMKPVNARVRVLEAANQLVHEHGPAGLTLDAAAREAGVSKGGLLYHFSTKEDLILGMLETALSKFEQDVDELARGSTGKGEWLKAFVRVTFDARPEHDVASSILAAASTNPALLDLVGDYFARWQDRAVNDGCDVVTATIVRLAADGLWFGDMFTTTSPAGKDRQNVLEYLLKTIDNSVKNASEG